MTMQSRGGFIFGLINAIGNFGAVFVDQSCVSPLPQRICLTFSSGILPQRLRRVHLQHGKAIYSAVHFGSRFPLLWPRL
jgi:hypothetical protein